MIDSMWMLTVAGALLAAVFGVLIAVLTWIGNKLYSKVDEMAKTMREIASDLRAELGDLRGELIDLDRRHTRTEAKLELHMEDCCSQ